VGSSNIVYSLAENLGFNSLLNYFSRTDVAVLMYHGFCTDDCPVDSWTLVRESDFEQQLIYLKKKYDIVSFRDVLERKYTAGGKRKVILTFDDGYKSNYSIAFPLLKKYNVPATIFVATNFIESGKMFWYDRVIYSLQNCTRNFLDLSPIGLPCVKLDSNDPQTRWGAVQQLLTEMKKRSGDDREVLAEKIANFVEEKFESADFFGSLLVDDIRNMLASHLIEIGSHTHNHEILTQLDAAEVIKTVSISMDRLGEITGKVIDAFSYPNGDYSQSVVDTVKGLGIECAFTTEKGFWCRHTGLMVIPRLAVGGFDSIEKFAATLSGFVLKIDAFKRRIRG
jgi:peptidoglycan/xylan/chitin deacetylase (PgdA/CDA1 family)